MNDKELAAVPSWGEAFDTFCADYDRYNNGHPNMPFQELRFSLALLIEELNAALASQAVTPAEPAAASEGVEGLLAKEHIRTTVGTHRQYDYDDVVEVVRAALASKAPKVDPVALVNSRNGDTSTRWLRKLPDGLHWLNATPAPVTGATEAPTQTKVEAREGLTDEQLCELEFVQETLRRIAGGEDVVSGTVERIVDIRRARGIASIAHRRLSAVLAAMAHAAPGAK